MDTSWHRSGVAPACLYPNLTSQQCCFCKYSSTSFGCVLAFKVYLLSMHWQAFGFSGYSVALRVVKRGVSMTSLAFIGSWLLRTHFWIDKGAYIEKPLFLQPSWPVPAMSVDMEQGQLLHCPSYSEYFSVLKTAETKIKVLCGICRN